MNRRNMIKFNIIVWVIVAVVAIGVFASLALGTFVLPRFHLGEYQMETLATAIDEKISGDIQDIDIDWVNDVSVIIDDSMKQEARIVVKSSSSKKLPEKIVSFDIKTGKLKVTLEQEKLFSFFSVGGTDRIRLEVYVPSQTYKSLTIHTISDEINIGGIDSENINIDAASSDVLASGIKTNFLSIDTVSGNIDGNNVTIKDMKLDTASGEIELSGYILGAKVNSVSGDIGIQSDIMLTSFSSDSVSGEVDITIPENDGFMVDFDSVSGDLESQFNMSNKQYKNGGPIFKTHSVSGDVTINKR